jgi:hypothetical protein
MRVETPLPARFGQSFASEAALRRSVEERHERVAGALERVRGAAEMTVRLLLEPAPQVPVARPMAQTGREYMSWLRDRQREADTARERAGLLQERVSAAVRGVIRDESRSAGASASGGSATISHLVACDDVARYRHLVHDLIEREPELRLLLSGPWAPYSFAELPGV